MVGLVPHMPTIVPSLVSHFKYLFSLGFTNQPGILRQRNEALAPSKKQGMRRHGEAAIRGALAAGIFQSAGGGRYTHTQVLPVRLGINALNRFTEGRVGVLQLWVGS